MVKNFISSTALGLLAVCSAAMCNDYKIVNSTGGILNLGPKMCYEYYTTPDHSNTRYACDPADTGVSLAPITTTDVDIRINAPDKAKNPADQNQGNYGWVTRTDDYNFSAYVIFPRSTSSASVNGISAKPALGSRWGENFPYDTPGLNISASQMLIFHAYENWLTTTLN